MTNLYFEELQIGIRSAAGPYRSPRKRLSVSPNNMIAIRWPAWLGRCSIDPIGVNTG